MAVEDRTTPAHAKLLAVGMKLPVNECAVRREGAVQDTRALQCRARTKGLSKGGKPSAAG